MPNKSIVKVSMEMKAVDKVIAALQTQQTRLNTLYQFQRQGATRPYSAWSVADGRIQNQAAA